VREVGRAGAEAGSGAVWQYINPIAKPAITEKKVSCEVKK
jgi:hypothetical protein